MEKSVYDALIHHLNDPDSINDEYRISDVVFAADNTIVSVLWEGNSKDGVSGMVTLAVNGKTVYKTKNTKVFCNHWILPYNGAEYHVLVDVLPKETILEEVEKAGVSLEGVDASRTLSALRSTFAARKCKAMVLRWARLRNSPTGLKWTSAAAAARTILGLRLSCTIIPARKLSQLNPAMALPAAGN